MDLQLKGQKALVTGGSKGIGLAIAKQLSQEGCDVVLVARSKESLESAAAGISSATSGRVEVMAVDLGDRGAGAKIAQAHPDLDILVNNAGDIPGGTIEQLADEVVRASWDVKVFGYWDLCRQYFPLMKARRRGVILNVIGVAGEMLDAGYLAGSVGNAALIAFTKALGSTSIEHGVRVVGINPGPVSTDRFVRILQKRAAQRLGSADRWRELEAGMPAGRAAVVDEIAATAALLCSPLSSYTSGTLFNIDGGLSNRRSIG